MTTRRRLRASAARLRLPAGGDGRRVLDVGCGAGDSTAALLAAVPYARVVAVDASAGAIARARPLPGGSVHGRIEDLRGRAPFDAAFTAHPDLADVHATLLRDLLVPGGLLVVHIGGAGHALRLQARLQSSGFTTVHAYPTPGLRRRREHTVLASVPVGRTSDRTAPVPDPATRRVR